jgi:hypothetical protein
MVYDRLHKEIENKKWAEISATLATADGKLMTKEPYKADLPLHMAIERNAPERVLLDILKANPDAATVFGKHGCLPLHLAAKKKSSVSFITSLIKVFPEALDELNEDNETPRDYTQVDARIHELLCRPTACWVDTVERDEYYGRKKSKIRELETKVSLLKDALRQAQKYRMAVLEKIGVIEPMVNAQELENHGASVQLKKVFQIEEESVTELKRLQGMVTSLEGKVMNEIPQEELLQLSAMKKQHVLSVKKQYEMFADATEEVKKDILRLKVKARLHKPAQVSH